MKKSHTYCEYTMKTLDEEEKKKSKINEISLEDPGDFFKRIFHKTSIRFVILNFFNLFLRVPMRKEIGC